MAPNMESALLGFHIEIASCNNDQSSVSPQISFVGTVGEMFAGNTNFCFYNYTIRPNTM